jgi:hypothetical protein
MRPKNGTRRCYNTDAPLTEVALTHIEATMAIPQSSRYLSLPQGRPSHRGPSQLTPLSNTANPPPWG